MQRTLDRMRRELASVMRRAIDELGEVDCVERLASKFRGERGRAGLFHWLGAGWLAKAREWQRKTSAA
jgi:hypothetical protein